LFISDFDIFAVYKILASVTHSIHKVVVIIYRLVYAVSLLVLIPSVIVYLFDERAAFTVNYNLVIRQTINAV
jgi:hypothetical protein